MRKKIGAALILLGTILIVGIIVANTKVPVWKAHALEVVAAAKHARTNLHAWEIVLEDAKDIPSIYPFSVVKKSLRTAHQIIGHLHGIQAELTFFPDEYQELPKEISHKKIEDIYELIKKIDQKIKTLQKHVQSLPEDFMDPDQKLEIQDFQKKIQEISANVSDFKNTHSIFKYLSRNQERVLILLQNQNEPRSTGGFTGSVVVLDFNPDSVTWRFSDIYSLDRRVPIHQQKPAPQFFHDLSGTLSLRDANFWPDFPTSSQAYRDFFDIIGEKVPGTVIAINLNLVEEILHLTGPIKLEKWGLKLDEYNFDLMLSFLVESKIAGRFNVKYPVLNFAAELFMPIYWRNINLETLTDFNFEKFKETKTVLASSTYPPLQKLFDNWNIAGRVQKNKDADNVLHFDFVSVGANKSEKFVWTKINHDSKVHPSGKVLNTLQLKRTHALHPGEIQTLLNADQWSENIRDLIQPELLWKLGEGQNRTVLRIYVPLDAQIISFENPSGPLAETFSEDGQFRIFVLPMFVNVGETLNIKLSYETGNKQGNYHWQPYYLQLIGTPGRQKTSFLSTISTPENGNFIADTPNIGRPQNLIDDAFRATVEFRSK